MAAISLRAASKFHLMPNREPQQVKRALLRLKGIKRLQLYGGARRCCGGRGGADGGPCPIPQSCELPARRAARRTRFRACAHIRRCPAAILRLSFSFARLFSRQRIYSFPPALARRRSCRAK